MQKSPDPNKLHQQVRQTLGLRKSWALWEWWVVATILAEVVGLFVIVLASTLVDVTDRGSTIGLLHLIGVLEGGILGLAQWLVLRHYVRHVGGWIIVTTLGALIAWMLGVKLTVLMVFASLYGVISPQQQAIALLRGSIFLGAWVGAVLGLAQWVVLRDHIRRGVWWVAANALAWSVGLTLAFISSGLMKFHGLSVETALNAAVTGITLGAVVGGITGIALVRLLKSYR